MSLIEILISIVLLGMAVAAMLTTLGVTIAASATERDHANAHAWLQTASDVLYGLERGLRHRDGDARERRPHLLRERDQDDRHEPGGMAGRAHRGRSPVQFWDGEIYQDTCYDDQNINLQLITIRVWNMENESSETVQVVKG